MLHSKMSREEIIEEAKKDNAKRIALYYISIYKQKGKYAIVERSRDGYESLFALVFFDTNRVTAKNYEGEGEWTASRSDEGIDYVANWVSLSTANKRFKKATEHLN